MEEIEMSFLFGGSRVSTPPLPAPVPAPKDEAAEAEAAARQRRAAALARGRATSILTSGQGVTEPPPLRRKELFGE
jgi:hypothetical protein